MGGFPAGGASHMGAQHPDGAAEGGQKGGVADPGPPPTQSPTIWNGPPVNWNIGQWTPATWNNDG
eukprot:3479513-Heterocapsa_arctica.AAC.1